MTDHLIVPADRAATYGTIAEALKVAVIDRVRNEMGRTVGESEMRAAGVLGLESGVRVVIKKGIASLRSRVPWRRLITRIVIDRHGGVRIKRL